MTAWRFWYFLNVLITTDGGRGVAKDGTVHPAKSPLEPEGGKVLYVGTYQHNARQREVK